MSLQAYWHLFRVSFLTLPYLYYPSFVGLIGVMFGLLFKFRKTALDTRTRNGILLISGLLLLSCLFAADRPEAFLQLANFLPYLLLFSVLPFLLKPIDRLEQLATAVVIATIPINLLAFGEYILRASFIPRPIRRIPLVDWVRERPHIGRAMVMFGHPNALAGYLVLVFGLGLGAIWCYSLRKQATDPQVTESQKLSRWDGRMCLLYTGTFLNLLGIFGSGSRNGLIVAVSQIVLFVLFTRASRTILLTGLVSIGGVLVGAAWLGIGGRSLSLATWANDPRVGVWKFAFKLISERPWLGWGLGNFKLQYPPGLIPDYEYIAHPHNFWLLLAAEAGIPAMIAFTLLVGLICYQSVRLLLSRQLKSVEQAILLGYLLSFWGCITFALFDVTFYDARINVTNWVVLSGLYTIAYSSTNTHAPPETQA